MQLAYYGHSCFEILIGDNSLLFDPYITPNKAASKVDLGSIKPDYILLSHGHEDHVADVELIYKNSNCEIISTFEVVSWFRNQGLENGHPMNHGGSRDLGFARIKMVNAIHSSSMPDGSYGGNPVGFVVSTDEVCVYYSGDTALTMDMKLIGEEFDVDYALLPIGDNFTMGHEDALRAARFVETKKVVGVHYNTFSYIEIDTVKAKMRFDESDIDLLLPEIGEVIDL